MYYIVFCVIAILVVSATVGLWRGLFRSLFGLVALILCIFITYLVGPYATDFVIDNTEIDNYIEEKIYSRLQDSVEADIKESLKNAGYTEGVETIVTEKKEEILAVEPDKATQIQLIDSLNLPEEVKSIFIENNNDETYKALGTTGFYQYLSGYAARMIVKAITMLVLFIFLRILLLVIGIFVNKALVNVPILSGVNRIGGLIFGLAIGLFVIWIFMIAAGFVFGSNYNDMISQSAILTKLDENNLLMNLFIKKM